MFIAISLIEKALSALAFVHPIHAITFLVCKKDRLPIGTAVEFSINKAEASFLDEYYKPDKGSKHYYRITRTSDRSKHWVAANYPSTSLQTMRTRGDFAELFIHAKNSSKWAWQQDYVRKLQKLLPPPNLIPAFYMAVWLYREHNWSSHTTTLDIIDTFFKEFRITADEKRQLFNFMPPEGLDSTSLFQEEPVSWDDLRHIIGSPPDAQQEEGGTLAFLEMQGVGPAKKLRLEPAERLSLITGDNGLGKTFILECAWWALSGQWAGLPAFPRRDAKTNEPKITFSISGKSKHAQEVSINYDWTTRNWLSPKDRPTVPGLLVYARVDGSFAVWDPAKSYILTSSNDFSTGGYFVLSQDKVWSGGGAEEESPAIEGLIRDWVRWQSKPDQSTFETFTKVLQRLSPRDQSDLGPLVPGKPMRLPGLDTREIPTLIHTYDEVPIIYASAGVRRIITLAYIIVWAWEEHKIHSGFSRKDPQKRIVILIDEMEAHLHPKWQRVILPALLDVREDLAEELQVQLIVATHSPLVMASVEPKFDELHDKLLHLDLIHQDLFGSEVVLNEIDFIRNGVIDNWLMSEVFELNQPRSLPAERAIEAAIKLQTDNDPASENVRRVSEDLARYLSAEDVFWPRWTYFAKRHGVDL